MRRGFQLSLRASRLCLVIGVECRRTEAGPGGKGKAVILAGVLARQTEWEALDSPHFHPPRPRCSGFSCRSDVPEEALLAAVFTENLDFDHSLSMCQGCTTYQATCQALEVPFEQKWPRPGRGRGQSGRETDHK